MVCLDVRVVSASRLPDLQLFTRPDSFCRVTVGSQEFRTGTKRKTLHPEWNEVFHFVLPEVPSKVRVEVWYEGILGNEMITFCEVPLAHLEMGIVSDAKYTLETHNAQLRLRLLAADFGRAPSVAPPAVPFAAVAYPPTEYGVPYPLSGPPAVGQPVIGVPLAMHVAAVGYHSPYSRPTTSQPLYTPQPLTYTYTAPLQDARGPSAPPVDDYPQKSTSSSGSSRLSDAAAPAAPSATRW